MTIVKGIVNMLEESDDDESSDDDEGAPNSLKTIMKLVEQKK